MKLDRRLYQRTIGKNRNGRDLRAWYYWYFDASGKKVIRSCGKRNEPCLLKRDAEARIAELEAEDEERSAEGLPVGESRVTIQSVAAGMYQTGGGHLNYRETWKRKISDGTIAESRGYLERWIIPQWGARDPAGIDEIEVKDWISNLTREQKKRVGKETVSVKVPLSPSTRNRVIEILNEVFDECIRQKAITRRPAIPRLKRQTKKKGILLAEDMATLFPDDPADLARAWARPDEDPRIGLCFGTLFSLMVSTGLRPGEARAVGPDQITLDRRGLIIDRMYDSSGAIVRHLKKGNEEDPRLRVAILPEKTATLIDLWIKEAPETDTELLFTYFGRTIRKEYLGARFELGLKNAGIDTESRNLTPHSLRFTYNTRMRRLIPGEALRMMTGHLSEEMTDYYTRSELMAELSALQPYEGSINRFWA